MKLLPVECHGTSLMRIQNGTIKQQAITCTNANSHLFCHMVSLGHSELNQSLIMMEMYWVPVMYSKTGPHEVFSWVSERHDDVIKWKYFPRYWPFVRGIHRSPVNSPHKGQWRVALMFSLICTWINGWVINRKAGDLRCHRAHYDVTVMRCSAVPVESKCYKGANRGVETIHFAKFWQKIGGEIQHFRHFCSDIGVKTIQIFPRPEKGGSKWRSLCSNLHIVSTLLKYWPMQ